MVSIFDRESDGSWKDKAERQRQAESQTERQTARNLDESTVSDTDSKISPELAETASRLRLAVTRTARKLRQEAGGDLTPTALATLASIERLAPLTPSELAAAEDVSRPTVTRVVNNLLEKGLIVRESDDQDKRSCQLSPTAEGIEYLAERRFRKSAYMAEMLDTLSPSEIETLRQAADLLDAALSSRSRGSRMAEGEVQEAST